MSTEFAQVLYDFTANPDPELNQLSVKANDIIIIHQYFKDEGWVRVQCGNDIGIIPLNYITPISEEQVRAHLNSGESPKETDGKSKGELREEMAQLKEKYSQVSEDLPQLEREVQELREQRKQMWKEVKGQGDDIGYEYFRIEPVKDLFYTVCEVISMLDAVVDTEKELEQLSFILIGNVSQFSEKMFQGDKALKDYEEMISPVINEIQTKLINQKANNDSGEFVQEFYDSLVILSDSLLHLLVGGDVEDFPEIFHFNPEETDEDNASDEKVDAKKKHKRKKTKKTRKKSEGLEGERRVKRGRTERKKNSSESSEDGEKRRRKTKRSNTVKPESTPQRKKKKVKSAREDVDSAAIPPPMSSTDEPYSSSDLPAPDQLPIQNDPPPNLPPPIVATPKVAPTSAPPSLEMAPVQDSKKKGKKEKKVKKDKKKKGDVVEESSEDSLI